MLDVKESTDVMCVDGVWYSTYEELGNEYGLDPVRLYHAHKKYYYIGFAVDYVTRNQHRNSLQHYDGTYRIDGETFTKFKNVAEYLNVSEAMLKKYSYGCSTWDSVRRKLSKRKTYSGYTIENVYYSSVKKVAEALDLNYPLLNKWNGRLGDIDRAIEKVRGLERKSKGSVCRG